MPECLTLPAGSRMRFVGDLHLGDGASNDAFGDKDPLLVRSLEAWSTDCDAVVFMGDAFDVPQAWSPKRLARAHPAVCAAIERLRRTVQVVFVRGNHDWRVDYEALFPRARSCVELTCGDVLAMHGHQLDRYCHPERRAHAWETWVHHLGERLLRFRFRVPLWEHDTWQNRACHCLGSLLGHGLRRLARVLRHLDRPHQARRCEAFITYWSRSVWGDAHALFEPALEHLVRGSHRVLVCGHTHLPGVVSGTGGQYVNAGSWAFDAAWSARLGPEGVQVRDQRSGRVITDEAYRWMIAGPDPGDFFDWWARHYRGWLRFEAPR